LKDETKRKTFQILLTQF